MCGISIFSYESLPDSIPSEYNSNGEITSYASKQLMTTVVPLAYLGFVIVVNALIAVSPQKFSMPNSKQAMLIIVFGVGILLVFVHIILLFANGDMRFFTEFFSYGMAVFLIVSGNVTGKMERNFFLGIRTPWTISTEENWKITHRLAARMMVLVGVCLLVVTPYYKNLIMMVVMSASTIVIPAFYSFIYFMKHERNDDSNSATL